MGQTLEEIAQQLHAADKKVQLIYAFNGTGKTRLSRALKDLIAPKAEDGQEGELSREKILYYNAFTEDLFFWNNDLQGDGDAKLVIQPNTFTEWILVEQGQEPNITRNFQRYANDKLTPTFNQEYTVQTKDELGQDKEVVIKAFSEVTFSVEAGGDEEIGNFKISKGEESNFIWSIFFTLLEEVVSVLSIAEVGDRPTDQFNGLQYVFVDDPVSSLDENHLIELAVNLADLITAAPPQLKFVITTHSPLFYNVLHNELDLKKQGKKEGCYLLERLEDGSFNLNVKYGDANKSFSYHLHLKKVLEEAIASNAVERYHFTLLRNLYEKTAGFLGYARWSDLLDTVEGSKDAYVRAINTFTHSALSNEQVRDPSPAEKNTVKLLLENLVNNYAYWQQDEQNG
ncbi:AAA family ATPase [Celeribacter sp. HF31]|uniref:AAA family ATPase n=1 Tax=Celeribacter sp. HF31 TaxID=2721558 RepID=UPI00142FCD5A|nr:AAA family ATPase [Celeribacter sp. HF31]NIY80055.1 AAA family ATPase [Celeribacter sp. HF31]